MHVSAFGISAPFENDKCSSFGYLHSLPNSKTTAFGVSASRKKSCFNFWRFRSLEKNCCSLFLCLSSFGIGFLDRGVHIGIGVPRKTGFQFEFDYSDRGVHTVIGVPSRRKVESRMGLLGPARPHGDSNARPSTFARNLTSHELDDVFL